MTYSTNTYNYITRKVVEIDGITFKVRPFTTAEQLSMTGLQEQIEKIDRKNPKLSEITPILEKITDFYVNLFDNTEEARKVFQKIPMDKYSALYNDIMENAPDDNDK